MTTHRANNTDDSRLLKAIFSALVSIGEPVVFPIHPRTRQRLLHFGIPTGASIKENLKLIDPVSYLDMLILEQNARFILTYSSGAQKEAFFFTVPCLTLRHETEWGETVQSGWNILVGSDVDEIVHQSHVFIPPPSSPPPVFGDGHAVMRIVELMRRSMCDD